MTYLIAALCPVGVASPVGTRGGSTNARGRRPWCAGRFGAGTSTSILIEIWARDGDEEQERRGIQAVTERKT